MDMDGWTGAKTIVLCLTAPNSFNSFVELGYFGLCVCFLILVLDPRVRKNFARTLLRCVHQLLFYFFGSRSFCDSFLFVFRYTYGHQDGLWEYNLMHDNAE